MENGKFKILNVVSDEKFIDGAIECMDLYSERWCNEWIICSTSVVELNFVKKFSDRIKFLAKGEIIEYLSTNDFDALILHSLGVLPPQIVAKIPQSIKVFWFGWGYDIYNFPFHHPFLKWNLYKPHTKDYLKPSHYHKARQLASKVKYYLLGNDYYYQKALQRIDYFSGVVDFEYDLMSQNPKFRAAKVMFSYTDLGDLEPYDKNEFETCNSDNILVGNSAAPTNNHLDLLGRLKKFDLKGRKLIIPLSYGGSNEYVQTVVNLYRDAFGDNVVALTDFMPRNEYKKYILSCGASFFFMERQQAIGNIHLLLKNGSKVFLSENNPIFDYYNKIGIKIFSAERDPLTSELSAADIENNRRILIKTHGRKALFEKLDTIYNSLQG